ncbi:MAG: hypothetical protein GX776_06195 [Oxalobacter sp.]|nr:hypothetical protein [Oxalobacter sp.]
MPAEPSETLEDIMTEPFTCTIYGADTEFGLYDQVWDDGSYIFYGYQTKNDPRITIVGQTISLQAEIIPEGAPERTNPFLLSRKKDQNTVTWYENALGTLSAAFVFLREFEEKRGFLLDGTLNSKTEKYYNHEDLISQLDSFSAVLRDNTLPFSRKVELLAPVLTSIRRILQINRIPDELKYEESVFYLNVLKLQEHVQWLIEETDKTNEDIIPDFRLIAEHLADVLTEIKDDHENVARGREPVPTSEEKTALLEIMEEAARIIDMKKGSKQAMQHIGRKLELCQKIWSSPTVDWQTRLDYATRAIDFISDAINEMEAAAIDSKKRHAKIPALSRYAEEINTCLAEFDKTGYAAITGPVAERFLSSINATRKAIDNPPLTKEALGAALKINSLLVSVTEKDDELSTSLHLYLADNDYTYALHYLYVLILNGKIHEMKIIGQQTLFTPNAP